jgi:hypoxanthine phosphoribosyltransferase
MPDEKQRSYDYAKRKGVRELSWEEFAGLSASLAERLSARKVDAVIGIARGGLFAATSVAMALRCEFYPVRLSRRVGDEVVRASPTWSVPLTPAVAGKSVAIIDDVADTGESLAMVAAEAEELGAARAITASLLAHTWASPMPDIVALTTDELVIFPWDRNVLIDGQWKRHPEIEAALRAQDAPDH